MSNPQTLPETNPEQEEDELRQERRIARMLRRKQQQRGKWILWGSIGGSIVLLALVGLLFLRVQSILYTDTVSPAINGITCDPSMQTNYHIHIHLTIYVNGKRVTIPQNIGINLTVGCFYWMHTHTNDGIIHIEAPQKLHNLALDDFLTIWHDGFSNLNYPPELNQDTGWRIYVNGKPFIGDIGSPLSTEVPLNSHDIVTLEYGSVYVKPDDASTYHFPANLPK